MFPMFENETIEAVIRKVLGLTYNQFGFRDDTITVARIAAVLGEGAHTPKAPERVREMIVRRYPGDKAAAVATCNLFYALGRENELRQLLIETNYTQVDYDYFIIQLNNAD